MKRERLMTGNRSDLPDAERWKSATATQVCAYIASAALHESDQRSATDTNSGSNVHLGSITLRAHQLDAIARLKTSIARRGGALLADAVGLGKTYVALAIAREFAHAHVIAPATLLPMWKQAMSATGASNISLHSLQTLSRRPIARTPSGGATIVIVDEAHHLRTHNTIRYRHAQLFIAGQDVLLLSATPVHNEARELRNLLSLFLGNRADVLDKQTLAECIVRRTTTDEQENLVPVIVEAPPHHIPDNREILECILQLAPPLPVNEGAAASALVRLGLLRAWCSSDSALTDRIRRRQLRGEALLHSLAHGRYPTQRELESWIVGNDSVQLGFPELLVATASSDTSVMLKTLVKHLDSLEKLLQLHTRTSTADASRSAVLRALLRDDSHPPIVAFSQFASTVGALHRALSDLAGIASLTSDGGVIASGSIPRQELIANFAPKASGRPPPAAAQQIRLLLSTDLLAEGVNLQDAGIVVHLDLPWTHALKQQRVGRVARMGSSHHSVQVHTLAPPMGAEAALQMVATLERKAGLHRAWIGLERNATQNQAAHAASAPDDATALRRLLRDWMATTVAPTPDATIVSLVHAPLTGWIAVTAINGALQLVANVKHGRERNESQRLANSFTTNSTGTDVSVLLEAVRAVNELNTPCEVQLAARVSPALVQASLGEVQAWIHLQHLQTLAGDSSRALSPAQKLALETLTHRVRDTSAIRRAALATRVAYIEREILNSRGSATDQQLTTWIASSASLTTPQWLDAFPEIASVRRAKLTSFGDNEPSVLALLILQRHDVTSRDESLK